MKLEEDKQFKVTDDAVVAILGEYGLGLDNYTLASSGIENTTLLVNAKTQKLVVRIYRLNKKPLSEIELELNFMEYLYDKSIKVPAIFRNKDSDPITSFDWNNNSWQIVAFEHITGEHASNYSPELIVDIAHKQAQMHIASGAYELPASAPELERKLKESYFLPLIDRSSIENTDIKNFLERAEKYEVMLNDELPSGLCHLDYDKDNIISENNAVKAILDFDDLAVAPFIVCLGYTVWHVWRYSGKQMADLYLNEYESIRRLEESEKRILPSVVLFRHYMISNLKILNDHTDESDARGYIELEQEILNHH